MSCSAISDGEQLCLHVKIHLTLFVIRKWSTRLVSKSSGSPDYDMGAIVVMYGFYCLIFSAVNSPCCFPVMVVTLAIFIFAIMQARRGNPQIWTTALSHYDFSDESPLSPMEVSSYYRASSLFNFSPTTGRAWSSPGKGKGSFSASSRDFFAPPSPIKVRNSRNSYGSSIFGGGRAGVGAFASPTFSQTQKTPSPGLITGFQSEIFKGFEIVTGGSIGDEDLWVPIKHWHRRCHYYGTENESFWMTDVVPTTLLLLPSLLFIHISCSWLLLLSICILSPWALVWKSCMYLLWQ